MLEHGQAGWLVLGVRDNNPILQIQLHGAAVRGYADMAFARGNAALDVVRRIMNEHIPQF